MRKKILFAVDIKNWAYHNIAKSYASYLTDYDLYYYITKDYNVKNRKFSLLQYIFTNAFNYIQFFILKVFHIQKKIYFIDKSLNFSYSVYTKDKIYNIKNDLPVKLKSVDFLWEMAYYFQYTSVTPRIKYAKKFVGIYTDSFPHEGPTYDYKKNIEVSTLDIQTFYSEYLKHFAGIVVGSKNLLNAYTHLTKNILFSNNILGQELFQENNKVGENEGLCLAWTGNPKRKMKNFYSIIQPLVESLQKRGLNVHLKTKFSGSYHELYTFYTDVDLVLIASDADTGPSMFAEAALSNVPAVSTNIGFPKMIIQNNINGIIVKKNTIEDFTKAIEILYKNRAILRKFSERIKKDYLAQLDNQKTANDLKKFFETQ